MEDHNQNTGRLRKIIEDQLAKNDKKLCLSYLGLPQAEWEEMPEILLEHHFQAIELEVCDLGGNNFGKIIASSPNGADFLTNSIIHFHKLRELDLRDNKLMCGGATKVFKVLNYICVETLEVLDVSENMIRDAGLAALSQTSLPYIRHLNLISNFITPKGISAFREFLALNENALETLNLDNNPIGNIGVERLCEFLMEYPCTLKTLTLGDIFLGDSGCRAMGVWLRSPSCKITFLNITVNCMKAEGLRALLRNLPPSLESLDVGGNALGNKGAQHIANYMHKLGNLKSLDLTCVGMEDVGATYLLNALIRSKDKFKLEEVAIDGNPLSNEIGVRLVEWKQQTETISMESKSCACLTQCAEKAKFVVCDSVNDAVDYYRRHRMFFLVSAVSLGVLYRSIQRLK